MIIIKRSGKTVEFDVQKIKRAIEKAFISVSKPYKEDILEQMAVDVQKR
ncbi:ribonucleoside-diphosphate reductase [Peptoniphilus indolicus ATCC 29427]|uniref:Ribonucleoside-diphosphate reductase n=1 Tax=Peptoniphilus indolicus ATCC 29427 TaxID=997350 RepID=G4D0X3_9FIRM|nr:ribonucleoside-diphosphate reductase [Peptoniphilus indolicus ATCC 29427]